MSPRHAPKIDIKSSLRPAPIKPAMPRTSPLRTENETSSTSFLSGASGSEALTFLTSKTVSPKSCVVSGKISPTSRPTIRAITLSFVKSSALFVPTVFPSRKTVMRSSSQKLRRVCARCKSSRHRAISNPAKYRKAFRLPIRSERRSVRLKLKFSLFVKVLWRFRQVAVDRCRDFRLLFAD